MKMSASKRVLALCVIFYLANQASSLKCYKCSSTSDGACWTNPKKSEYEQTCPGSRSINSDSTLINLKGSSSLSALANISVLIDNEMSSVSRSAYDPDCLQLIGSVGQQQGVIRMCILKGLTDEQLRAIGIQSGFTSVTIIRCDTDLCNSSSTLSIGFLTLASSLLLIFSIKI